MNKRASSWVKPAAETAAPVRAHAVVRVHGGYRLVSYELPADVAAEHEVKRTEPEMRGIVLSQLEQELEREHEL